jgi:hypothetical protein
VRTPCRATSEAGARGAAAAAGSHPHPAATSPATSAATPAATVTSCTTQTYTWAHSGGGLADLAAVGQDVSKVGADDQAAGVAIQAGGDTSAALAALTADASQLGADSQTALANLPPSCIPGEVTAYRSAMAEHSQASQDSLALAGDASSGDYASADSAARAATTALDKGNADVTAATTAISTFNSSP